MWKQKNPFGCTYRNLLKVCCDGGDSRTAEAICKVLTERAEENTTEEKTTNGT